MNNKSGSELPDIARRVANNLRTDHFIMESYYDEAYEQVAEAVVVELSHLQKLCEEQRDTLDAVKEAVGGASLHPETGVSIVDDVRDLKAQVEEQKGELAGWVNLVKQIGLKVNCLYSNFSDDNGHILKAIDSVQSQLATQTERVQALEKELEVLRGK